MKQKTLRIIVLLTIFLTSCGNYKTLIPSTADKCIPPLESIVYSASPDPMEEWLQIPPNWQIEREIYEVVLMSRKIDQEVELWFTDTSTHERNFLLCQHGHLMELV